MTYFSLGLVVVVVVALVVGWLAWERRQEIWDEVDGDLLALYGLILMAIVGIAAIFLAWPAVAAAAVGFFARKIATRRP